jgi:hypothetical protein
MWDNDELYQHEYHLELRRQEALELEKAYTEYCQKEYEQYCIEEYANMVENVMIQNAAEK